MARSKEKRRRKRIDVALALTIGYNEEKIRAVTKNLSLLGTYIEINRRLPADAKLNIELTIRNKQINCEGVAFRSSPVISLQDNQLYGTGIFFRSFSRGSERTLANYIDYVLLREKKAGKIFMLRRKRTQKRKGGK